MERSISPEFRNEREALIWAAALFEGEGCISWSHSGRNGAGKSNVVQVRLGMTDLDSVQRFANVVGFGKIYKAKPGTGGWKPVYNWAAYGFEHSQAAVAMFWPWLGSRRREKAVECLAATRYTQHKRDRVRCPAGHLYSGANLKLEMNRVGGRTYISRRCAECRRSTERAASARYRARKKV